MNEKIKTKASKPLSIDKEARTIQVVMTTNEVDRDMDIVETMGIDTKSFENNPVVLWAHNPHDPPIGSVVELSKMENMLLGTVKFAETPRADEIFKLYEQGHLKTWSIGFQGTEIDYRKNENGDVMGYHFLKSELRELSAVPIPANPSALVKACKGLTDQELSAQLYQEAGMKPEKSEGYIKTESGEVFLNSEEVMVKEDKITMSPNAFLKSSQEKGKDLKVEITVEKGEETSTEIHFEVVKVAEEVITECKLKSVRIVLSEKSEKAPLTPQEPSRTEEDDSEEAKAERALKAKERKEAIAAMQESLVKSLNIG